MVRATSVPALAKNARTGHPSFKTGTEETENMEDGEKDGPPAERIHLTAVVRGARPSRRTRSSWHSLLRDATDAATRPMENIRQCEPRFSHSASARSSHLLVISTMRAIQAFLAITSIISPSRSRSVAFSIQPLSTRKLRVLNRAPSNDFLEVPRLNQICTLPSTPA